MWSKKTPQAKQLAVTSRNLGTWACRVDGIADHSDILHAHKLTGVGFKLYKASNNVYYHSICGCVRCAIALFMNHICMYRIKFQGPFFTKIPAFQALFKLSHKRCNHTSKIVLARSEAVRQANFARSLLFTQIRVRNTVLLTRYCAERSRVTVFQCRYSLAS
jgi:hypothetical protein